MQSALPVFDRYPPRKTIYDYFHQALRNSQNTLRDVPRELVSDNDGNCVAFEVSEEAGRIREVRFKCTTCFTLVALCEHIVELACGMTISKAREIDREFLLELHPEVPPQLADRASLASQAFRAALQKVTVNLNKGEPL
ncbi:MAG TPA: iron-sulfur cluster assembly scaffold protein [Terriglobales bacterium]|nr:iron-sulfur cluster assembly scaffold protein [Terriglobales bacterium]